MPPNSITLDFQKMPTVTVDGKTQKFQADKASKEFQEIKQGGVTYSLVKDADSGRFQMTIKGEPAALEKYNFSVGKGRVTNASFGKGDSMDGFFKGTSYVGDQSEAPKYFESFSIGGAHLADRTAFLQSGAWGLDQTSADKELERLEQEAKKAKEAEGAKKNSGTQDVGEQTPVANTDGPQLKVSDPANSSPAVESQKEEEPKQSVPPMKVEIKDADTIEQDDFPDDVVGEDQLEANLKALESKNETKINALGIGLPNDANNCFQNAALAALQGMGVQSTAENAPRLQNYLKGKVKTHGQAVALREEVARKMELPKEISQTIKNGSSSVQHDAVEVFEALLMKSNMPELEIEYQTVHNPQNGSDILRETSKDRAKILKLPVPANVEDIPMQNLIQNFSKPSDVNDVQFEGLKAKVSAERASTLKNAPEKLAVQIGRMNLGDSGKTVRRAIEVPDVMNKITLQVDGQSVEYQPTGIIVHVPGKEDPTNAKSGHYIYYQNFNGKDEWLEINDDKVRRFDITKDQKGRENIQNNCYLVTYEKITGGADG